MTCPDCGFPILDGTAECEYCGRPIEWPNDPKEANKLAASDQPIPEYLDKEKYAKTKKVKVRSKAVAGMLAIFLGSFGAHYFYLGKFWRGLLLLVFCWTYIPWMIGVIQGFIILCQKEATFERKWNVICK